MCTKVALENKMYGLHDKKYRAVLVSSRAQIHYKFICSKQPSKEGTALISILSSFSNESAVLMLFMIITIAVCTSNGLRSTRTPYSEQSTVLRVHSGVVLTPETVGNPSFKLTSLVCKLRFQREPSASRLMS